MEFDLKRVEVRGQKWKSDEVYNKSERRLKFQTEIDDDAAIPFQLPSRFQLDLNQLNLNAS